MSLTRVCLAAAALLPLAADGSFGGGRPCGPDFACQFEIWGLLLGSVAIPISAALFAVLHMLYCNGARSKRRQFFLGGFLGVVAYLGAAAFGALIGTSGIAAPGEETGYLLIGLVAAYAVSAFVSVRYARSSP